MRKVIVAIVLIAGVCNNLASQEQPPASLTFKEAVSLGLKNNVLLNQQKNTLASTQMNKTSALLGLGPSISAQGSAYRVDGNSFNQNEGKVVNGTVDFVNGSVDANMPLINGLNQLNTYRQANNANEAQFHFVQRSSQDVIRDVANQFLMCLLDKQLITIGEQNLAAQRVQYDQIQAQVETGSKAEADLYNQEYQLKNAEVVVVRAKNALKNDMATLALTLQVDPATPFEIIDTDWDINAVIADSLALEDMYNTAMNQRSDLKQAMYNEKAARFGYSAIKGNYYPSLNAGVSYGSRYNYIYGEDNRSFHEQFTQDNTQLSYGVSLNIPIYGAFFRRSQAVSARVTYENAKIRNKNAEVTVKTDVIRVFQNFNDAKINFAATQSQLRAAELSYQMEKERYDLGISNIVQLTTANQAYVKAQGDFQGAKFTLMFQRLLINYAIGTLKFEDIP